MIKRALCVKQTKSKLVWGVNYSKRDIMSMSSLIKALLPNAISTQKYVQDVAPSLPKYLRRKKGS